MSANLIQVLGGLGLFLFGMSVMTEGLRALTGKLLHRLLGRFTRSPLSGAVTGGLVTALLQSSSATTVAAVGFVGAGLLTFAQALGIIFGANLGTTVTGWLVALLGLKLSIGSLTLPLVLLGALMRLFGRGRSAAIGTAIAGFGIVFLGISILQQGTAVFQDLLSPETFPADTLLGRLLLVGLGVAITLVTQSSSAGVAAALAAVYTGAIEFPQAAALVIGMDVGTTVTAALATLGGSRETRRTGYSHVIYNLVTGVGAFFLLPLYVELLEGWSPAALTEQAELALVGFHSLFNLLGVMLILPLTTPFARLMYRLVPDEPGLPEASLDRRLLSEPAVALDTAAHLVMTQVVESLAQVRSLLTGSVSADQEAVRGLRRRVLLVRSYLDEIHLSPGQEADWKQLTAVLHLLDHLGRLLARCEEQPERVDTLIRIDELRHMAVDLSRTLDQLLESVEADEWDRAATLADDLAASFDARAERLRADITADIAAGRYDMDAGSGRLEAVRWVRRVSDHIARIMHHARGAL